MRNGKWNGPTKYARRSDTIAKTRSSQDQGGAGHLGKTARLVRARTGASIRDRVDPAEARIRLSELVGDQAEDRPEQGDYTSAVTPMFAPCEKENLPKAVIAEAGTGVGKTLGYIAPASIWAERNSSPIWISTYTKHLQRQIDIELEKLYPDPEFKKRQVVIRKGRENYLCLLNFEDAVNGIASKPETAISIGLVARWAGATRDGDINGGDFPSWLSDLFGFRNTLGLSDRRGECIFSACAHYAKCFIERTIRRSQFADIVVSNHALVMAKAALGVLMTPTYQRGLFLMKDIMFLMPLTVPFPLRSVVDGGQNYVIGF